MITVRFFRKATQRMQKFERVFKLIGQCQDDPVKAHWKIYFIEYDESYVPQITIRQVPMNDAYIQEVY